MTQYCVLSSQITSVGYVGNVICLKFAQESFKVLFEKELVKNMMYLMWELNPRLSVHENDTLPSELTRFYIYQAGFELTTFRTTVYKYGHDRNGINLSEVPCLSILTTFL